MNFQVKDFEYSTKNIPLASKNAYLQVLIAKTESLIQRMRWKAFFFLNKNCNDTSKESYGFKSKRSPPHVAELNEFEGCMLEMIQRVEFRTNTYSNDHRRTGRGGRGRLQPPQILGNSDFLGSARKFGQSQFLKTSPCLFNLIILKA